MIKIKPNPLKPFKILYKLPKGTWMVINISGRGSGKSYEVSKFITLKSIINRKRVALLRDQQSTIAQSILHEVKTRWDEIDEKSGGYYSKYYEMQDKGLKNLSTQTMQIFTKGFQTSATNKKATLKSIADVDIAVVEEFEDINDEEAFNSFADSIRKEDALIIINSNVPSKQHWFIKRYFNLIESDHEGFYKLSPKTIPGVVYITSS
jgi:PBSX family phage terminase large subunit